MLASPDLSQIESVTWWSGYQCTVRCAAPPPPLHLQLSAEHNSSVSNFMKIFSTLYFWTFLKLKIVFYTLKYNVGYSLTKNSVRYSGGISLSLRFIRTTSTSSSWEENLRFTEICSDRCLLSTIVHYIPPPFLIWALKRQSD